MTKKPWHLDSPFQEDLFDNLWPRESQAALLRLFKFIDQSDEPVMSALPEGIWPGGAAAAASLYFLAGMQKTPSPHCKIALFPGYHFVRGIKNVSFNAASLFRVTQIARSMMRGELLQPPALDKLRKNHKELDQVNFHWLFKCERIWTQYGRIQPEELSPRGRFGMGDDFGSTIDILDCEDPAHIGMIRGPYNLLIYCAYYHSNPWKDGPQLISDLMSRINTIKAERKLILVRSPYDFWARELERRSAARGVLFQSKKNSARADLQIKLIDQFINVPESFELYDAIERHLRSTNDRELASELKSILRNLLVSVDPGKNESEFNERIYRLGRIRDQLSETFPKEAIDIFNKIIERATSGATETKKTVLLTLPTDGTEIWVTKDRDRKAIEELVAETGKEITVRLMDRWTPAGKRTPNAKVILTRVDREGDLDAVSYLRSGDTLLLSAWELIIKAKSVETAWERSQRWHDLAMGTSFVQKATRTPIFDPVLDLADYTTTAYSNAASARANAAIPIPADQETWWDRDDVNPQAESNLSREEILGDRSDLRPAKEIELKGGWGVFLLESSEVQVLKTKGGDEFDTIAVEDLEDGDLIVLFRDAERSSIFDLVMDQLERSTTYGFEAIKVREWKRDILKAFVSTHKTFTGIQESLAKRGYTFNPVTVRSWITGPTMAPLRLEAMKQLAEVLGLRSLDVDESYRSVNKIRNLARVLGRAINELITTRDHNSLSPEFRRIIEEAEIDIEDLASAIDVREVSRILPHTKGVSYPSLKKVFKY